LGCGTVPQSETNEQIRDESERCKKHNARQPAISSLRIRLEARKLAQLRRTNTVLREQ